MAGDRAGDPSAPLAPGPLLRLANRAGLEVDVAPEAGGRIAQIRCDGAEQLVGHGEHGATAAIAWGCYPMVPWCGRIRDGRFGFDGNEYRLPRFFDGHAIHGVGYVLPWRVEAQSAQEVVLSLALPRDGRWPFGGEARQRVALRDRWLELELSVVAGERAMPVALGWHPWFRKPERLDFRPEAIYPRDRANITRLPPGPPRPGPWDDCFVNRRQVVLHRAGQRIHLESACHDWVVYDEPAFATCVEPQTAPPDAFNLVPDAVRLQPGASRTARFTLLWE